MRFNQHQKNMSLQPGQIAVDLELKKAFQELQTKMIQTTQQLKISDVQIETLKKQITHSRLVNQEIAALPSNTRTYQGVGRMFILEPIPVVQQMLANKMKAADEKIKSIETNKKYLEKNMQESEANIREMVMSKKQKS